MEIGYVFLYTLSDEDGNFKVKFWSNICSRTSSISINEFFPQVTSSNFDLSFMFPIKNFTIPLKRNNQRKPKNTQLWPRLFSVTIIYSCKLSDSDAHQCRLCLSISIQNNKWIHSHSDPWRQWESDYLFSLSLDFSTLTLQTCNVIKWGWLSKHKISTVGESLA